MSEGIYNIVQFGRQSAIGTGVAATTVFPVDAGFLGFELDRGYESPNEDYGRAAREHAGRGSYGVRLATASLPFTCRFQDIAHILEMHVTGSVSPSGSGTYTYAYPYDATSMALKHYTVQYGVPGSTQDEWRAIGVICSELELGFDALSAPGNSMWKGTASLVGIDRGVNTLTSSQSPPATLETMEGHLTTFAEGDTSTAFGSLSAVTASLKQFSLRSSINAVGRVYGGSSDTATAWGRSDKATVEFDAVLAIGSTLKTDVHDVFNVSGSPATDRRWRITVTGSSPNTFTIDARVRFDKVDITDHDDERLYAVHGYWVDDSTLTTHGKYTLVNSVASIP